MYALYIVISRLTRTNPDGHVPPHRIWMYLYGKPESEFSEPDHDHISICEQCYGILLLCLRSENFGAVLRELGVARSA